MHDAGRAALVLASGDDVSVLTILVSSLFMLLLAMLSAAFSGSEAALFSLTRAQLEQFAAGPPLRRLAAALMDRPRQTLAVILLGNTTVNVLLFANTYVLFNQAHAMLGAWSDVLAALVGILIVTIGGEAIPKTIGVGAAERVAPLGALYVRTVGFVLAPLSRVVDAVLVEPASRLLIGPQRREGEESEDVSTEELRTLLEMSRRRGEIDPVEDAFVREIIHLDDIRVRDVMIPRVEMKACDVDAPPDALRRLMRETRFKKIPVYEKSLDNIVGLVYAKVLFLSPVRSLRQIVVPVRFVPDLITGEQLLAHFRSTKSQIAIAVDEYGGLAGLVTLEDVLESIVGDLRNPQDEPEIAEIIQISDDEFDVSGRLGVRYWAEVFHEPELADRFATIGGLVTAQLGRPARAGDLVQMGNVQVRVMSVARRRIQRLRVRRVSVASGAGAGP
ncbi:Magnesium and cobalt efflux protein CorC [Phycisphaerae bacterium RAS1]|nr:Magnesium and cobalt efflux protein CorC [Phycisphaerae bacterium RAS1]